MILVLPRPLSVNGLFINVPGKGRVISGAYERWKKAADDMLWQQKRAMQKFKGPVHVTLTIEDKGRIDADNCAKCCLDFAVRHGIIEDDTRTIVRKLTIQFADIEGSHLEVVAA